MAKALTTETFLEKARRLGTKYDFSKVVYKGSKEDIEVICPIHGSFYPTPNNFLKGSGCPECGKKKAHSSISSNADKFVAKARKIHGDKYDYSKVNYINNRTAVVIGCPIHGDFDKRPDKHLIGQGCPKCSAGPKRTTEDFIREAEAKHGKKYSYGKTDYKGVTKHVIITCPVHGDFKQLPSSHLAGFGCARCGRDKAANNTSMGRDGFIERANKVHNNKYDYSKLIFKSVAHKGTIICPIHGEFEQRLDGHLEGRGCSKCYNDNRRTDVSEFISKANEIHNNRYDYSKVSFRTTLDTVTIGCPVHGDFQQVANEHLRGRGCLLCAGSKNEKEIERVLNKFGIEHEREYGIKDYKYKYDFYLNRLNIFIEYNGNQHYIPIKAWGGNDLLKEVQTNDAQKAEIAKKMKVRLNILHNTKFQSIEGELRKILREFYKYTYNGKSYQTFEDMKKDLNLPGDAKPEDYTDRLM